MEATVLKPDTAVGSPAIDPIDVARGRLIKALQKQPMDVTGAGISAYLSGALQSARIDALTDLYLNPPNNTWTKEEAMQAALVRAMNKLSDSLEAHASKIQIAGAGASPIHLNGSRS